jgi:hypothetical protein
MINNNNSVENVCDCNCEEFQSFSSESESECKELADIDSKIDDSGRWRALALISVSILLALSTWFSATAILSQLKLRWQLSSAEASSLIIILQLGFASGAFLASLIGLADFIRPMRLVSIGSFAAALFNALIVPTDSFAWCLVFRFLTGVSLALVYPPGFKGNITMLVL